jgi:quercetin dioxygenase-like cupin family protein
MKTSISTFTLAATLTLAACDPPIAYPPLTVASLPTAPGAPVHASAQTIRAVTLRASSPCDVRFLAVTRGGAVLAGPDETASLGEGDVLVMKGPGDALVRGTDPTGVDVVIASYAPPSCDASLATSPYRRVVPAAKAPELAWAGGAMKAHLDVEPDVSPSVYLGRLAGTMGVAEHVHESSWEILCAIEAAGTFTLDGAPQRLGPGACVFVPPNTKHSWTPDAGSHLRAVQMYSPPGPEQRFKKLAAGPAPAPAAPPPP